MARNLISFKTPHRTLRPDDSPDEMVQKINQNFTIIWQLLGNLDDRVKTLEKKKNIEYVERTDTEIVVQSSKGNRNISLSEVV